MIAQKTSELAVGNSHISRGFGILLGLAVNSVLALVIAGCSSAPKATTAVSAAPVQPTPAQPAVVDAGVEVETATVTARIEVIDSTRRGISLRRADGTLATYRAGPEVVNFDQLKAGDEVVMTVTETCALFVVTGGVLPGVTGSTVIARAPKGAAPGGMALSTLDYNATILDIEGDSRKILLKYGPDQAKSIKVGPGVELSKLRVGDDVLVRATEAMAITVVKP